MHSNDCNTHAGRELAYVPSTAPAMVAEASLPPQIAPDVAVLPEGSAAAVELSPGVPAESLGLNVAISSNRTAASTQAASTVDDSHCGVPSCGQTCSAYTTSNAAALHNQNYLWFGTSSTCFVFSLLFVQTQYQQCCVQTCSADSDCPTSYYCQSGWNVNGGSVCIKCDACATTQNTKCQEDQQCQFPCCLNPTGDSCLAPGVDSSLSAVSGDMCCPSLPSSFPGSYIQDGSSISCHCNTQQICSSVISPQVNTAVALVPPSPPPTPPPESPAPPPPPPGVSLLSASL